MTIDKQYDYWQAIAGSCLNPQLVFLPYNEPIQPIQAAAILMSLSLDFIEKLLLIRTRS